MRVAGIDPGLSGGIAVLDETSLMITEMPSIKAKKRGNALAIGQLYDWADICLDGCDHAFIEEVGAMPGQGISSMFKFGYIAGELRALVASYRVPVTMVAPVTWKKALRVPAAKDGAVARADQLFPAYASLFRGPRGGLLDGVAEAALIAYYGRLTLTGGSL